MDLDVQCVLSLNVFLWRRELGFIMSFWKCWIEMHEIMAMCLSKFNSCLMKSTVYFWWQVRVACFLISCSSVMKKQSGKRLVKYLIAFFCVGYAFSISNRKVKVAFFALRCDGSQTARLWKFLKLNYELDPRALTSCWDIHFYLDYSCAKICWHWVQHISVETLMRLEMWWCDKYLFVWITSIQNPMWSVSFWGKV